MTDNDIVKALERCIAVGDCSACIYNETFCTDMTKDALDLINRQRAENERLKKEIKKLRLEMSYMKKPNTIGDVHEMGAW